MQIPDELISQIMPMWGITIIYNDIAELYVALSHRYLNTPKVSTNCFFGALPVLKKAT